MGKLKHNKGFTLVELITVIVILGVLMALVIPTFNSVVERAEKVQLEGMMRNIYVSASANAKANRAKGHSDAFEIQTEHDRHIKKGSIVIGQDKLPPMADALNDKLIMPGRSTITYRVAAASDAGVTLSRNYIHIYVDKHGNVAVQYEDHKYQASMYKSELEIQEKDKNLQWEEGEDK